MIKITNRIRKFFVILLMIISPFSYSKGVGLNATRIIYPEGENSVGVIVRNEEPKINYLVQAYISSDENPIVFQVTPPLFRINSLSRHEVKIYAMSNSLPKDRESIFYFHAKMIPGQSNNSDTAGLSVGFDNVIKLFYRPKNLPMTSEDAQKKLKFSVEGKQLKVVNNSPYYINFAGFSVNNIKLDVSLANNNAMIAPYSSIKYALPTGVNKGSVQWRTIDDLGGFNEHKATF